MADSNALGPSGVAIHAEELPSDFMKGSPMNSLPPALAVAVSALLLAGCSSVDRSAAPIDSSPTTSASSVATTSAAPSVEASSASASNETSASLPAAGAFPSEANVKGASKSTRVCVVNRDTIGDRFNRVLWDRYDTNTGMKMPLNESVCAEGGFFAEPDVEGMITIADGPDMVNNTTEVTFTAFNPGAGYPWIKLTGPGLDKGTRRLSEGERFLVSAQDAGRERRLLTIERLPDTQWKEFRITISTPRVCESGGPCAIGDTGPGGGIVFYDAGGTRPWGRYLEVAPQGWSGNREDPKTKWCAVGQDGYNKQLSTDRAVGSGRNNSLMAARDCPGSTAPSLAVNYTGGGKKDWYLPAYNELLRLYTASSGADGDLFHGFEKNRDYGLYWTSSMDENYERSARIASLNSGDSAGGLSPKEDPQRVRPIRAF